MAYPELQSGELVLSDGDAALIVAAVNEYEAHLDLEEALREFVHHVEHPKAREILSVRLARIEELRHG